METTEGKNETHTVHHIQLRTSFQNNVSFIWILYLLNTLKTVDEKNNASKYFSFSCFGFYSISLKKKP